MSPDDDLWRLPEPARPTAHGQSDRRFGVPRRDRVAASAVAVLAALALAVVTGVATSDSPSATPTPDALGTIQLDDVIEQGSSPATTTATPAAPPAVTTRPTSVPTKRPTTSPSVRQSAGTSPTCAPRALAPAAPPTVPAGPRVDLVRYLYYPYGTSRPETYERMQTTGEQPGGAGDPWRREDLLASAFTRSVPGSVAFTECRWASGFDYFLSLSATCEGHVVLRQSGYVLTEAGPGRLALYLCRRGVDHFVSTADNCLSEYPGHSVRLGLLGYGVS